MSNAKHTPGPWSVDECPHDVLGADGQYLVVAQDTTVIDLREHALAVRRANARLIAAAPELLEALERIASCVVCDGDMRPSITLQGDEIRMVNRAIAKAKGGAE